MLYMLLLFLSSILLYVVASPLMYAAFFFFVSCTEFGFWIDFYFLYIESLLSSKGATF